MNFNILKYVISKNVYDHIDPLRSFKYEMPLYFSSGLIWNDFMNVRKKSVWKIFLNNVFYRPFVMHFFDDVSKFFIVNKWYRTKSLVSGDFFDDASVAPFYV